MTILLAQNKTFRGPYTDTRPPMVGEAVTTISPSQYFDYNSLDLTRVVLFDTTFRYATSSEAVAVAPTLQTAMVRRFSQLTDPNVIARVVPMYTAITQAFTIPMPVSVIRSMITNFDASDDNSLASLQSDLLVLTQWPT